ncbi:hypothetical protein A5888_001583 [Enterococcus sp. 9E7_DIV0242]|uniref:Pyridoxamine 5'-phosphate oxidase N-terminal domain-containing protein n=1 Tax=Candidatus Enterococcus clewellii TaxID=1834193 RepID=A0A242K2Y9_9ENTE|nr:hypothetical protein A5888_003540 [Enterococcus sp. 9E7_DIV0242]
MELHERILKLLNSSTVFLIATVDQRGFPNVITVSRPLWREGLLRMRFYVDGEGETVQNILKNPNGSVCCYQEMQFESMALKGKFTIEPVDSVDEVESSLTDYQRALAHKKPVVLSFETWTAKIHIDKQTKEIIV